jgi:alkylhydroperoxidase family enzyme
MTPGEVALLDFAVRLAKSPSGVRKDDLAALRGHGFTDEQRVDAIQCIGYFNLIIRVHDGLGVDPEPAMRYGKEAG